MKQRRSPPCVAPSLRRFVAFPACLAVLAVAVPEGPALADLGLVDPDRARGVLSAPGAVNAEDSLPRPPMRIGRTAQRGVRDDDTLDGSATAFASNDRNWLIQWQWDGSRLLTGITYTAYARIKMLPDDGTAPRIQGGVYDVAEVAQPIPASTLALDTVPANAWFLVRYGRIRPARAQYIWLAGDDGPSGDGAARILFDRFIMVPQIEGDGVARILAARRPDSPLTSFSMDATRQARLVFEFQGAPVVTLNLLATLGANGRLAVRARPWHDGSPGPAREIATWTGGIGTHEVPCPLLRLFEGSRRTQLSVLVTADDERAAVFGALGSPGREDLPLRAVWCDPPMGSAGHDVVDVDAATRTLSFRNHFDAIVRDLNAKLPAATPIAVRVASATRKVYRTPGGHEPRADWLDARVVHPVQVAAARNEYESFQLVLIPVDGTRHDGITCRAGAWHGPGALPPLVINPVGYVDARPLGYAVGRSGATPDPLMPPGPMSLPADGFQPVWCTVHVPGDASAGRYRTQVTVTVPGDAGPDVVLRLPIDLEVWDFALADETHLRTDFWFNRGFLKMFYGVEEDFIDWEVMKRWFGFHLDHRVTPRDHLFSRSAHAYVRTWREPDGSLTFDFAEQDRLLAYLLDERRATGFNIGPNCNAMHWYDRWPATDRATGERISLTSGRRDANGRPRGPFRIDDDYRRFMQHFLSTYWAHLKARGWASLAFHQMFDEPGTLTPELLALCRLSHQAAPGCPVLTTSPWGKFPEGAIDIHVPLTNVFDPTTAGEVRARGARTWWYVCSTPKHPHANFFLEYPAEDPRILPWLSWKFGAQGILYWGTNDWAGKPYCENVGHEDPADRWPHRPWFTNPYRPVNGEGYLLYPGPGMTPLASIRLVNLREGMEDYEYLWTLSQLRQRLAATRHDTAPALAGRIDRLLAVDPAVARSLTDFAHDPALFAQARRALAAAILEAKQALSAAR